jgi:glycine oxidase
VTDAEVLVIGGGVVGCAVARRLAQHGVPTLVVDRGVPGTEASHAAAGMLSPQAEADAPGPFLELLRLARARFPGFTAELRDETGIDIEYRDDGTLLLAFTDEDVLALEKRHAWQSAAALPVDWLDRDAVLAREPALSEKLRFALRFPEDHQVDNRRRAEALHQAAVCAGAEFRTGSGVARIEPSAVHTATVVHLEDGTALSARTLVLAAGCWSGGIDGLPRRLPVRPVHGQLLALHADPPLLRHVVDSPRTYLVPRASGRVVVGATSEERGFGKAVTPRGLLQLLNGAVEICPALADTSVVESWSGLRPGTADSLPILGPDPRRASLVYATGHYRNGILLAPLTGELIAELILTGTSPELLRPFGVARFG